MSQKKDSKAIEEGEIPLLLPSELTKHDPNIGAQRTPNPLATPSEAIPAGPSIPPAVLYCHNGNGGGRDHDLPYIALLQVR